MTDLTLDARGDRAPAWFWGMAGFGVLWNLYGIDQFVGTLTPAGRSAMAAGMTAAQAELLRLENRLPGLADDQRDEVARAVRRVVDKLLHAPTVRVKQLAGAPGGDSYAEALRELFELDPQAVDAVAGGEIALPPVAGGEIGLPATHSDSDVTE